MSLDRSVQEIDKRIKRQRRKFWQKIVGVMACFVVFCTTYALILPAITMSENTSCGMEEHLEHSVEAGCYTEERVLICSLQEEGHVHSDECRQMQNVLVCTREATEGHSHSADCYTEEEELACGRQETVGHTHSDFCYTEEASYSCGLEEDESHTHGEDCLSVERILVCGMHEEEPHTHTADCMVTHQVLTCGQEEREPYVHTDSCYELREVLACGLEEAEPHTHNDDCYSINLVLTCEKPIHEHEKACYADPTADLESAEVWERTMKDVELTGDWRTDVLAIAESQLGYTESTRNFIVDDSGSVKGYSRYGAWYGSPYGDWCAMYAAFCLRYAGVDKNVFPASANCQRWIEILSEEPYELYHSAETYIPQPGDLIFFDFNDVEDEVRYSDHIGIVAELITDEDENIVEIKTIEGNSSDKVQNVTYPFDDEQILGYGELVENPELYELSVWEKACEGDDYLITVRYGGDVGIPAEAELSVREILEGSEEYMAYFLQASEALGINSEAEDVQEGAAKYAVPEETTISFARFFDISFLVDGQEIEPTAPVDVIITYKDAVELEETCEISVVHFAEEGTEVLEVETSQLQTDTENAVDTFTFTQESFSVSGTLVTSSTLPDGEYLIYVDPDGKDTDFYALSGDGKAVQVDVRYGVAYRADGTKDLIWIKRGNTLQNKETGKYLYLGRNSFTSENPRELTFSSQGKNAWWIYRNYGGNYYNLIIDKESGYVSNSQYSRVYFAAATYIAPADQREVSAEYEHHKVIDYLGDALDNDGSETNLMLEDLYRLKLDMTGVRKPVDLLLVVDASGSMKGSASGDGITNGMPEVIKFLNGTGNGTYGYNPNVSTFTDSSCDGFIKEFFELNDQNRLGIVAFGGYDTADKNWVGLSSNSSFRYTEDAWIIKDWNTVGSTYSSVPVAAGYYPDYATRKHGGTNVGLFIEDSAWIQGTDYCAGIMRARDMFNRLGPDNGERIRVMVFLSDGLPTYSIVPTADTSYPYYGGEHYMRRGQGQKRWYDSGDISQATGTPGIRDCYTDSEWAFEKYQQEHPEVVNYSIAFRMQSGADDVLKYMGSTDAERTNAVNFKTAEHYADIMDMILGVFHPRDVSITDKLSEYVSLYEEQPDVLVTMTPKVGGDSVVLWRGYNTGSGTSANRYTHLYYVNNQLTRETRNIVKEVRYDTDGTITVQFDEFYTLEQRYTYALSFNVRATDAAYDRYAVSSYVGDDRKVVLGDKNTDYPGNTTSSDQPGLFSNDNAYTSFITDNRTGRHESLDYDDPVIQVDACKLNLIKLNQYDRPLSGAVFTLKRGNETVGTYTSDANGTVTIDTPYLITGSYTLVETVPPDGYDVSDETISFTVSRGMIEQSASTNDWIWGNPAQKVTTDVNGKTGYPKNQLYLYNLTLRDKMKYDVLLQKTDSGGIPLNGATFTLYQDVSGMDEVPLGSSEQTFTIQGEEKTVQVRTIANDLVSQSQTLMIDGREQVVDAAIFRGTFEDGTYYLVENTAPAGYCTLTEPVVLQIDQNGVNVTYRGTPITKTAVESQTVVSVQIANTKGYKLPETGGTGTKPFTIGGALLMSASLLFGLGLRRKRERRTE